MQGLFLSISSFVSNLFGGQELIDMLLSVPAVLLGICFHEYAHARAAYQLGDSTAKDCGRMTLNPVKHFHPIGFLMLVFAHVGFARPVPVNPYNFKNRKRDDILVSLAGPAANVLLAILFTLILKGFIFYCRQQGMFVEFGGSYYFLKDWTYYVYLALMYGVMIDLSLAIFNMLPIPPLDGSHLFLVLMPDSWRPGYSRIQPYLPYVFLVLWLAGGLSWLVSRPLNMLMDVIMNYVIL